MLKLILSTLIIMFNVTTSRAEYVQTCKIKFESNSVWSDYYTVEVTFISGRELNTKYRDYSYADFKTYAIIFWENDEVTIIEINSYTGCGTNVDQSCIINKPSNLEGKDQEELNWEICTMKYCY